MPKKGMPYLPKDPKGRSNPDEVTMGGNAGSVPGRTGYTAMNQKDGKNPMNNGRKIEFGGD